VFRRCEALDSSALHEVDLTDTSAPGLRFDIAAQTDFDAWRAEFERSQRTSDDHPALVAHRDKYRKLIPALALICHLADNPSGGRIGAPSLLRALGWAEYAESHARRAYASVARPEITGARELLRRIRAKAIPERFRVRDVYLKGWTALSKPEQAHQAARMLADLDYIREHNEQTGGRASIAYIVNPRALA
jgi:putative DNA primase/helicase